MPIDASIIAGLRTAPPVKLPDPMEQYSKSLALQNLMRQGDAADRSEKRSASLQALLATNPDEQALRQGGFLEESLKVGKAGQERAHLGAQTDEINARAAKSKYDVHIDKIQRRSSILSTATDQASWDAARRMVALSAKDDEEKAIASQLPEQFDPVLLKTRLAEGQTIVQKLADERAREGQAVTTRGQDMTAATALAGQNVTTRGQDLTNARATEANTAARGTQQANLEGKIRDDYTGASKQFVTVRDAHQRVIESAKDPSAAGDLALIFNYMKVLDPGSTVREGEFATAQNAAGMPDRMRAQYNKVVNGERLAEGQRADFLDRSGRLYKAAETNQVKTEGDFKGISERSGARPENVVISSRISEPAKAPDALAADKAKGPKTFNAMPDPAKYKGRKMKSDDGTVYISDGNKWKRS